jgi:RNA polymerase sigma factor (TIGR02999 family)
VPEAAPKDLTGLLVAWRNGDRDALDRLVPEVYGELRRLAHHFMRSERPGHPLQTTALVNEAYLRMVDVTRVSWQNRAHFFAVAAQMMRRVLVDAARERDAQKRGGDIRFVPLEDAEAPGADRAVDLVALDEALDALARFDPRKARVVELRYFGGLDVAETAEVLEVSPDTVMRDWKMARLWLFRELQGAGDTPRRSPS